MDIGAAIKAGASLAAAGIFSLFGVGGHGTNPVYQPRTDDGGTARTTTTHQSVDLACVSKAVAARETSLASGMSTFTGSINSAYSTRSSAMQSAFSNSTPDAIRTASKTAWTNFMASTKSAHDKWHAVQQSAWTAFASAVKACGGSASTVSDVTNATADASVAGS